MVLPVAVYVGLGRYYFPSRTSCSASHCPCDFGTVDANQMTSRMTSRSGDGPGGNGGGDGDGLLGHTVQS
jgi:hypothetical protein